MKTLQTFRAIKAKGLKKGKEDVFRLLSLSTILLLFTTFMQPAPIDMIYILLIESLCFIVLMLLSFFMTLHIGVIVLGLLMSVILVPLLLLFLYSALMMIVLMLGLDAMTEGGSAFPLINHSITILDGNFEEGLLAVANYFGDRLYWIIGGILLHHLVFDMYGFYQKAKEKRALEKKKSKYNKSEPYNWRMDMFFHFTFKAMVQSSVIMLLSLIIALPIAIIAMIWPAYLWLAYVLVIVFRLGIEWYEKEMGEAASMMD